MQIDFSHISIPTIEGEEQIISVRRDLGNALYYQSTDLTGSELGRKIYLSEGPVSLSQEEKDIILKILPTLFSYVVSHSIETALAEK